MDISVIPQEAPFCVSRQISRIREEKSNGAFEGPAWQGVGIFHRDSRLYLVQSPFFLPHWKKKAAQVVTLHSYTRTNIHSQLEGDTKRVHSAASGTVCIPETRFVYVLFLSIFGRSYLKRVAVATTNNNWQASRTNNNLLVSRLE